MEEEKMKNGLFVIVHSIYLSFCPLDHIDHI